LAAFSGFFLDLLCLFFCGLFGLFLCRLLFGLHLLHLMLLFSANCATFGTGSATSGRRLDLFFSATCTGFGASPATCVGSGQRDAAHADQAGNAQRSKQFFQIFFVHNAPLEDWFNDIE